jgi:hypothetical protein
MKDTVDKCLAFCQAMAKTSHRFSFSSTIGKATYNFSTFNQRRKVPARQGGDLKKVASSQLNRRQKRAADPAVRQKAAAYEAKAAAEKASADAAEHAATSGNSGANGEAQETVKSMVEKPQSVKPGKPVAKKPDVPGFNCDQCSYENASERGLKQHKRMKHVTVPKTPEKERHCSLLGDLSLNLTLDKEERGAVWELWSRHDSSAPG